MQKLVSKINILKKSKIKLIIDKKIKEFSIIPSNGVNRINIDLNDMSNGIYFVNFNNNILKYTEKIIIAK